jgi:16S rRNA (uracil1498-N3)-methyltransferase
VTSHFFVAPERIDGGSVALLDAEDTHHLTTVLRARTGTEVSVADGSGTVWSGRYDGLRDGEACVALLDRADHPPQVPQITVVHALPKQRKLDDVIQRLTELGVDRIVPVHSARSPVELDDRKAAKALARWRAVAMAAAKQSRRARLTQIAPVGDWATAFADAGTGVVCWEESTTGLRAALERVGAADALTVGIGPEGGLTADEVAGAGLPDASLGNTVLRTETAALVAVSAIRYHFGLMEPAT